MRVIAQRSNDTKKSTHVAVPYIAAPCWLTSRTHWSAFDRAS